MGQVDHRGNPVVKLQMRDPFEDKETDTSKTSEAPSAVSDTPF